MCVFCTAVWHAVLLNGTTQKVCRYPSDWPLKLMDWLTDSCLGVCCRAPQYWHHANEFNPDRFSVDNPIPNEITENFWYLPFGGGRRKCIGEAAPSLLVVHVLLIISWAEHAFQSFAHLEMGSWLA